VLVGAAAAALGASGGFPGRNGGIVFDSQRRGNVDLFLRRANGQVFRVTRSAATEEYPAFSADGALIAFGRRPRVGTGDIYVVKANGKGLRRITRGGGDETDPTWAPDGLHLAYTGLGDDDEIYSVGADGRGAVDLTDNPDSDLDPAWSPDGTKIAFASNRDDPTGEAYEIYVMDADGSNQVRLTHTPGDDGEPSWSPDGTHIAFVTGPGDRADIAVMDADGSNLTTITHNGRSFEPAWSPDGTKIAFSSLVSGRGDLFVVRADGTGLRRLTRSRFDDGAPDWQPLR
jgi:Tol biopolymer transport system component